MIMDAAKAERSAIEITPATKILSLFIVQIGEVRY
jgi:hypothetical protein